MYIISSYTKTFALPGIRMGYVMSTTDNISKLKPFLPEWNISSVAASLMKTCAKIDEDGSFIRSSLSYIAGERQYLLSSLSQLGFTVFDSDTVFILFKDTRGINIYEELLKRRILIRDCSDIEGLSAGFYRIGIRNHEDNETIIKELGHIIDGKQAI